MAIAYENNHIIYYSQNNQVCNVIEILFVYILTSAILLFSVIFNLKYFWTCLALQITSQKVLYTVLSRTIEKLQKTKKTTCRFEAKKNKLNDDELFFTEDLLYEQCTDASESTCYNEPLVYVINDNHVFREN